MAFVAFVPLVFVLAAEYRKIKVVVLLEIPRIPTGFSGMAKVAISWESRRFVVGVVRVLKIGLVAGETVRRGILKNPSGMAGRAVVYLVAFGQREKIVVLRKARGRPARVGGVADGAVCWEASGLVVGGSGGSKIGFVAGKTIGRCARKSAIGVACVAVAYFMPFGQWEKSMVGRPGRKKPRRPGKVMAIGAFCRITCRLVVGAAGSHKIFQVAIGAVVADAVETEPGFRKMAVGASCCCVVAEQGEAVVSVQFRDFVHQPVFAAVAAGTVAADGHLVHIVMAAYTFTFRFRKY